MGKAKSTAKPPADAIGDRGESIFKLAITDYSQFAKPIFRAVFLAEKWPVVDFVVELVGPKKTTPVFFVQVKATTKPFMAPRFHVTLPAEKRRQLAKVPGPTYLVGVHEPSKRAFIRAVDNSSKKGMTTIRLANELTPNNLKVLFDEVRDFWDRNSAKPPTSAFD